MLSLLIAYWLILAALTHSPRLPQTGPRMGDKTAHFLAYGILASLLFLTLWTYRPHGRFLPLVALAIPLIYGVVDEVTQPLSGRLCELGDWLADAGGAAIAVVILSLIRLVAMRRRQAGPTIDTPSLADSN